MGLALEDLPNLLELHHNLQLCHPLFLLLPTALVPSSPPFKDRAGLMSPWCLFAGRPWDSNVAENEDPTKWRAEASAGAVAMLGTLCTDRWVNLLLLWAVVVKLPWWEEGIAHPARDVR